METVVVIFSVIFGYGALTLVSGAFPGIFGGGGRLSFVQQEEEISRNPRRKFSRTTFADQVGSWLYQADADITLSEFLMVSSMIGGALGAVFLFATRAILVAVGAFLLGFVIYYIFLLSRRENNALEYEKVQPQVVSALYMSFKTKGVNLDGVLEQIAEKGPTIVREDWRRIRAAFTATTFDVTPINELLNKRASPALTAIVSILITYRNSVNDIPEILNSMREEIAQDVDDTTTSLSALKGPRQEMGIVAAVPVAVVLFYISGGMGDFYGTVIGQVLIIAAWLFTAAVYFIVNQQVRKAVNPRTASFTIAEARGESDRTIAISPPNEDFFEDGEQGEEL
jgi:Flp pilus assembly protein TadB